MAEIQWSYDPDRQPPIQRRPQPWLNYTPMESTGVEGCVACTHLDGRVFCEGRPTNMCMKEKTND